MRRSIQALPAAVLVMVSLAAPAAAAVINGTSGPDVLVGTARADTIHGFGGADRIYAGNDSRRDLLYGGPGNDLIFARFGDRVYAGRGNDVVRVRPAAWQHAYVDCGPGYDHLYGSTWLVGHRGCEKVN